jgi:hypothetical protein
MLSLSKRGKNWEKEWQKPEGLDKLTDKLKPVIVLAPPPN